MAEIGHYAVHRKIWDNWLSPIRRKEKFTEFEAWEWLVKSAYYFCTKKLIQKKLIVIPRGYFDCTVLQLSETWKWHRNTVEKFLQLLEKDLMIKRFKVNPKSDKSCTLIKVNNYNAFQPNIYPLCTAEYKAKCKANCTGECTPNKKVKKDKNIKNTIVGNFFIKPTLEEVKKYCTERTNNISAETFIDFYESKGWMVGKSKMKDWKACVRNWERNRKDKKEPTSKAIPSKLVTDKYREYKELSEAEGITDLSEFRKRVFKGVSNE